MDARVQRMRRSLSMWVQCIGGKCVSNMRVIGGVYDGVDPGGQKCQSSCLTLKTRACHGLTVPLSPTPRATVTCGSTVAVAVAATVEDADV